MIPDDGSYHEELHFSKTLYNLVYRKLYVWLPCMLIEFYANIYRSKNIEWQSNECGRNQYNELEGEQNEFNYMPFCSSKTQSNWIIIHYLFILFHTFKIYITNITFGNMVAIMMKPFLASLKRICFR